MQRKMWAAWLLLSLALSAGCDGGDSVTGSNSSGSVELFSPTALDENGSCSGVVEGGDIENLIVDDGQTCALQGTEIDGNVFVRTGSTLIATDIVVGGNIQSEGAALVDVGGSSVVHGNVQVKQGLDVTLNFLFIGGDLQLDHNAGHVLANANIIHGNLQVVGNSGGVTLTANETAENMQCKENSPEPTGGGNIAGDKEDQCENL